MFKEFGINAEIKTNLEFHGYLKLADEEFEVAQMLFNICFYRDSILHSYLVMNFLTKALLHWKGFRSDDFEEIILLFNHVIVVGEKFPEGVFDPMIKARSTVHKVVHDKKYYTTKEDAESIFKDAKRFFEETMKFFENNLEDFNEES